MWLDLQPDKSDVCGQSDKFDPVDKVDEIDETERVENCQYIGLTQKVVTTLTVVIY